MSFELDPLSYALLASIFSAAALLSVRNARGPDIHPLLLNTQSDVSRVRYSGSSAVYRSRMYPNGAPLLSTVDRTIRTLRDFYQAAFDKHKSNVFVGKRGDNKSFNWVMLTFPLLFFFSPIICFFVIYYRIIKLICFSFFFPFFL